MTVSTLSKRLAGVKLAGVKLAAVMLAGAALGSVPALAADLGDGRPVRPPRDFNPPIETRDIGPWSGFYLGATAGYGFGQGRADGDIGQFAFDQKGALGTIFAGYNWQAGRSVLGIEADIGTGNQKSTTVTNFGTLNTGLNSVGSVRGRAGVLLTPALLLYGTGGFAWSNYDIGLNSGQSQSKTFTGYQLGAGAELMISSNVTLRTEYIYTGLGREVLSTNNLVSGFDPSSHAIRAGVAIKF